MKKALLLKITLTTIVLTYIILSVLGYPQNIFQVQVQFEPSSTYIEDL